MNRGECGRGEESIGVPTRLVVICMIGIIEMGVINEILENGMKSFLRGRSSNKL
jgi:hypothetical protein